MEYRLNLENITKTFPNHWGSPPKIEKNNEDEWMNKLIVELPRDYGYG